jgi:hypothetical protein
MYGWGGAVAPPNRGIGGFWPVVRGAGTSIGACGLCDRGLRGSSVGDEVDQDPDYGFVHRLCVRALGEAVSALLIGGWDG